MNMSKFYHFFHICMVNKDETLHIGTVLLNVYFFLKFYVKFVR